MEEFLILKTHFCQGNLEDKRDELHVNSCMLGVSLKHISLWIYIYIFCIIDNFFNIWHMNGKIGDKILDETNFLLTLLRHKTIKVNMFSCVNIFLLRCFACFLQMICSNVKLISVGLIIITIGLEWESGN